MHRPLLLAGGQDCLQKLKEMFNPNIRGIGEKSPTFVQNDFTP